MESDEVVFSHKQNKVPATNAARVLQIANLGLGIAGGTISEAVKQALVFWEKLSFYRELGNLKIKNLQEFLNSL